MAKKILVVDDVFGDLAKAKTKIGDRGALQATAWETPESGQNPPARRSKFSKRKKSK